MSNIAIRVEGLSKRYRIGEREPYKALRDVLAQAVSAPVRRLLYPEPLPRNPDAEYIWALKDVSFEVKRGEVLGIIGRNGAGKSTLLKILSRITAPTEGYAEIHGRVGSLLEVGTGFHPELTGRENIYLNGAILGMKKAEIDRKFDEIVEFAEVERFLDTPVKRYSSGMLVRLAFAVAAHLEPEILLVDEVLAVGDIGFQKKCLKRMENVAQGGRTILFVSHQMTQIRRLCERVIWLDGGEKKGIGPATEVISAYESAVASGHWGQRESRDISQTETRFVRWEITEPKCTNANLLTTLGPFIVRFIVKVSKPIRHGHHGIALWNRNGQLIWGWAVDNIEMQPGLHELVYALPSLPLRPGVYQWQVSLYDEGVLLDNWHCIPELVIGTKPMTHPRDEWSGILNLPCSFTINRI